MFGIAIAAAVISPAAFLATGFYGVSRKRAEEGRAELSPVYRSTMHSVVLGSATVEPIHRDDLRVA